MAREREVYLDNARKITVAFKIVEFIDTSDGREATELTIPAPAAVFEWVGETYSRPDSLLATISYKKDLSSPSMPGLRRDNM